MSQYPINNPDDVLDGLNYLLSGPSGLGQNFQGFSAYTTAYLTGNYRSPFTQTTIANLYVPPIALSDAELLDPYTWKFTFSSAQPSAPFALGSPIYVTGVNPSDYDGQYSPVGVIECTTTYVIARTQSPYTAGPYVSGGTVEFNATTVAATEPFYNSTDCNARVTINGGTDRVFITAQLNNIISYDTATGGNLTYGVYLNRYYAVPNDDPVNPDFKFLFDKTISQKIYSYTGLSGTGSLAEVETIFATVIDQPPPNYYWYILEVAYDTNTDVYVTTSEFGLRCLSAQVVKQ